MNYQSIPPRETGKLLVCETSKANTGSKAKLRASFDKSNETRRDNKRDVYERKTR